jgi:hypothetical protein
MTLFLSGVAMMLYAFNDRPHSFFSLTWLIVLFNPARGVSDWLVLGLIVGLILAFWTGGARLAQRPLTQTSACLRFDLGVTAFFILYLTKLLLVYKAGIHIHDPYSGVLVYPFFIFSLLALGAINHHGHAPKTFISGFRGIGMILSFSVLVIGLGTGAVLLFLPYLTVAAEGAYTVLKTAAGPLQIVVVAIVRFLTAPRRMHEEPVRQTSGPDEMHFGDHHAEGGWLGFIYHLIEWIFMGMAVLLGAAVVCAGIWWLVRWVRLKFGRMQVPADHSISLCELLKQIGSGLRFLGQSLAGILQGYTTAAQIFGAVMRWGRRSGIARLPAETPLEYSLRLTRAFPALHSEIALIVEAYHAEIYREMLLSGPHLKSARAAWQCLRSPRHWPSRFKTCFFGFKLLFR